MTREHDHLCPMQRTQRPADNCMWCDVIARVRREEGGRRHPSSKPRVAGHAVFCWCEACNGGRS